MSPYSFRHPAIPLRRRTLLHAGLALGTSCLAPSTRACEVATLTLTIVHPWTRATAEGAPFAVVCMSFKDVLQSDRLIGAESVIATGAAMGGEGVGPGVNFTIHEGQTSVLEEGGVHLRLLGLKSPLEVGRQYPLTLTFAKAGTVVAPLTVDYERFR